ncbi:MAG: preprotein translocase subunit SecG [Dehalococcoidia bacterium]|nr:preprotein translocase subunit SecG [Chloroflexota bacterium]MCK4221517.1 preprotein translocase subunit SecG [Dehalococcoidia bacterium]MCK4262619.1 preprotein translocase subunit SecG [Dehalococcoidia bacterium]MCK4580490.1 preprotein translocase subunit SecG [Dehalococcoidia bacterium]
MPTYLAIAQILVCAALIATILFQTRGGGLGGIFGQPDSVYRTRRGVEKTLFHTVIVLAVVFVIFAMLIVTSS